MSYVSSNGFVMQTTQLEPIKTPAGLLVTRAVQTKAGWVGQILVDKTIIWEGPAQTSSSPDDDEDLSSAAVKEANWRVVNALRGLLGDPPP